MAYLENHICCDHTRLNLITMCKHYDFNFTGCLARCVVKYTQRRVLNSGACLKLRNTCNIQTCQHSLLAASAELVFLHFDQTLWQVRKLSISSACIRVHGKNGPRASSWIFAMERVHPRAREKWGACIRVQVRKLSISSACIHVHLKNGLRASADASPRLGL